MFSLKYCGQVYCGQVYCGQVRRMTKGSRNIRIISCHQNHCVEHILCLLLCLLLLSCGQLQDTGLVFSQAEEQSVGQFVGSVSNSPLVLRLLGQETRPNLRYNILFDNKDNGNLFKIDSISGNISFAKRVDREVVCPLSRSCEVTFGITITGHNNFFTTIPIKVNIIDINDNAPTFQEPAKMVIHINEDSPENFTRRLAVAMDADSSSEFGITSYFIDPPHEKFHLDFIQNFVGISQVSLVVTQKLDREIRDNYQLIVVVTDGGRPPKSGTMMVSVIVDDVNDNSPKFSEKFYSVNISEEAGAEEKILVVTATDADIGDNGQVVYTLSTVESGNSVDIMDMINVNRSTGVVTLKKSLVNGEYRFLIDARDLGSPNRYDQTVVLVTVLDTINNQPTVRMTPLQKDNLPLGWVSEESEVGTVVAVVSVEDPDSGSNANVTCESQTSIFQLERLDARRYKLILASMLDRETNSMYTSQVICQDQGVPSLNSTASLVINVFDVNDNSPEFLQLSYVYKIVENNLKDDTVAVINAVDNDEGRNAEIEYRLVKDLENFSITSDTGVIKANRRFDRELVEQYQFQVLAIDHGDVPLTGTAMVTINIIDVNDVDPVFSQPIYQFRIHENSNSGSFVGNITVTDPDLGDGGAVSLSLRPSKEKDQVPFTINHDGRLTCLAKLDREATEMITFYVLAMDNGIQRRSSSAQIIVHIIDMNDNHPIFAFPGNNFSTYINMPIKQDTTIIHVDVYDLDLSNNSAITFSIIATNASERFRIGKFSGDIVATKDLSSHEDVGIYFITINATDQGTPVLWQTRTFQIILQSESGTYNGIMADQNVLIVACLICFTVIVSGVMLVTICLLRKQDRRKKRHYHASFCPDNQPDIDMQITERNTLQCDLTTAAIKDQSPKLDKTSTHSHPNLDNHNSNYSSGSNIYKGDQSIVISSDASTNDVHSLRTMGHSLLPISQRHQVLELNRRQEDFPSLASAETVMGDSGHGSDEDMSNSIEHVNTQTGSFFSTNHPKPNIAEPNRKAEQDLVLQTFDVKRPPIRTSSGSSSVRFDPQVKNKYDFNPTLRTQFTNPNPSCNSASSEISPRQPQTCSTFRLEYKLPNRYPHQHRFYQHAAAAAATFSQQQFNKKSCRIACPPQERYPSSSISSSSMGDSYTDDSGTTTSGSYSLCSDNTTNLYHLGQPAVTDVHV